MIIIILIFKASKATRDSVAKYMTSVAQEATLILATAAHW